MIFSSLKLGNLKEFEDSVNKFIDSLNRIRWFEPIGCSSIEVSHCGFRRDAHLFHPNLVIMTKMKEYCFGIKSQSEH